MPAGMSLGMAKTIHDHLPKKTETIPVQAKCDKDLAVATKEELDRQGITWRNFIEASMKRFLEEAAKSKRS